MPSAGEGGGDHDYPYFSSLLGSGCAEATPGRARYSGCSRPCFIHPGPDLLWPHRYLSGDGDCRRGQGVFAGGSRRRRELGGRDCGWPLVESGNHSRPDVFPILASVRDQPGLASRRGSGNRREDPGPPGPSIPGRPFSLAEALAIMAIWKAPSSFMRRRSISRVSLLSSCMAQICTLNLTRRWAGIR